jgi:hypothetical protein
MRSAGAQWHEEGSSLEAELAKGHMPAAPPMSLQEREQLQRVEQNVRLVLAKYPVPVPLALLHNTQEQQQQQQQQQQQEEAGEVKAHVGGAADTPSDRAVSTGGGTASLPQRSGVSSHR